MIASTSLALASDSTPTEAVPHWLFEWANIANTWELGLVAFGMVAQAVFFGRWIMQWIASERRGESHMPEVFWWLSLSGATMLLMYYLLRGEPVGVIGQSVGWVVYSRNLYLIRRRRALTPAEGPGSRFEAKPSQGNP